MEVRGRQEFEPKAGTGQMGGVQPTCSRPAVADCPSAPGAAIGAAMFRQSRWLFRRVGIPIH